MIRQARDRFTAFDLPAADTLERGEWSAFILSNPNVRHEIGKAVRAIGARVTNLAEAREPT